MSRRLCLLSIANKRFHLLAEARPAECLGVLADSPSVERMADGATDGVGERLRRRLVDEPAGLLGHYRFTRAAASERDHRPSARLRLERHDPEILLAGQQGDARAAVRLAELLVRAAAEEARRSIRVRFEPRA